MTTVRSAVGSRGSWFATINGSSYPCVHESWYRAPGYDGPHYIAGDRQWDELVDAIKKLKSVILTKDTPSDPEGTGFTRTGDIGLFEVDEISAERGHLRFRCCAG